METISKKMFEKWKEFAISPDMIYLNGRWVKKPIIEESQCKIIARANKQKANIKALGRKR